MSLPKVITGPYGRDLPLSPAVMGILNGTPDSFFPGSRVLGQDGVRKGLEMAAQGAGILDIGGESTRPGSQYVDADTEIGRVLPLIQGLRSQSSVPLSVDTRKYKVAKAAFEAGADWVNDITALGDDPLLGPFVGETGMPVVLMHMQGTPVTMQTKPQYQDIVAEVGDFLKRRVDYALGCGVREDRIVLDPGIGFGKSLEGNLTLLRNLDAFSWGFPVLVGLSRKSFINLISPSLSDDRLGGSLAGALWALRGGVGILRVHDVGETVQALKVWDALGKGS